MEISEDIKNEIINLFTNTYKSISKILKSVAPNGEITLEELYSVLNEYSEKNPDKMLRKNKGRCKNVSEKISNDEIFELREKGLSYKNIADYYNEKGISISKTYIKDICRKIYKEKGKKEPDLTMKNCISAEEIYQLKEQGLTYQGIKEYYEDKGVQVSKNTIICKAKKIYDRKGKEEFYFIKANKFDEDIIRLRKQGYSYKKIAEYFRENGVNLDYGYIMGRYKKIGRQKELEKEMARPNNLVDEKNDTLCIEDFLCKKHKNNCIETDVAINYKATGGDFECANEDKGTGKINLEMIDKNIVIKEIRNLKNSKNATDKQIAELAKLYGIELDKEEVMEL